jgi:hypothetical protein
MVERSLNFSGRRLIAPSIACLALLVLLAVRLASGQQVAETMPKVSDQPLTAEQLAVYRTVLHGWMENEVSTINLSIQTIPFPTSGAFDAGDCGKELELEPVVPGVVHRFRPADLAQLGSDKIGLVDAERQRNEVAENDPGKTIGEGRSIEDAVRNGFAHGLVTLSEIRFDKAHNHAIVSYSFFCGSLCGNGGTVILEKVDGAWQRKSRCSEWIS